MRLFQNIDKHRNFYSFIDNSVLPENLFAGKQIQTELFGRASVSEISVNGRRCIVRNYKRGGLTGLLLKNRYFRPQRFINEFLILKNLEKAGFPTTRPAFLQFRRKGLFYYASLGTLKIENQINFFSYAREIDNLPDFTHKLIRIFELIKKLGDLNIYHPDIQLKNILISNDTPEIFIIDFDKACFVRNFKCYFVYSMFYRFMRSIKKHKNINKIFAELDFNFLKTRFDEVYKSTCFFDKIQIIAARRAHFR